MKRSLALMAVAAFCASPALADDEVQYSDDQVTSCLAEHAETPRICIGLSAAACQNASDAGSTTIGLQECSARETAFWDAQLNATYGELMQRANEVDAMSADDPGVTEKITDTLQDMQRRWIDYRDATCTYEVSQFQGGTIMGPVNASCLLRMTAEQAIYLAGSWPTN